jgi:hypothetical protein
MAATNQSRLKLIQSCAMAFQQPASWFCSERRLQHRDSQLAERGGDPTLSSQGAKIQYRTQPCDPSGRIDGIGISQNWSSRPNWARVSVHTGRHSLGRAPATPAANNRA